MREEEEKRPVITGTGTGPGGVVEQVFPRKNVGIQATQSRCSVNVIVSQVSFKLNEELSTLSAREEKAESLKVPRDHPFIMQPVGGQTLAVYTQTEGQCHVIHRLVHLLGYRCSDGM
ncbi:hypothetical protein NHX12_007833 [Muraenolepis orangiensis]|uniref:Uncharacterized protein n=1 Tax=Muraenolepis orangiensis TaxID=630683 RepID=A0A9Q0IDC9_9TELE|nr:hypothetical protein NHX12_007833 [Muraenolepis orangiensis]